MLGYHLSPRGVWAAMNGAGDSDEVGLAAAGAPGEPQSAAGYAPGAEISGGQGVQASAAAAAAAGEGAARVLGAVGFVVGVDELSLGGERRRSSSLKLGIRKTARVSVHGRFC